MLPGINSQLKTRRRPVFDPPRLIPLMFSTSCVIMHLTYMIFFLILNVNEVLFVCSLEHIVN